MNVLRVKPTTFFQALILLSYNSVFDSLNSKFLDKTRILHAFFISLCPLTHNDLLVSSPFSYFLNSAFHCQLSSSFYGLFVCLQFTVKFILQNSPPSASAGRYEKQPTYVHDHVHTRLSKLSICCCQTGLLVCPAY